MGECKLASLQRLFESPQSPSSASHRTPSTLFNVVGEGGGIFYVLLSKCSVYIAEGGPLCVPLQISRSKRGKHGYINKRSLLTAL